MAKMPDTRPDDDTAIVFHRGRLVDELPVFTMPRAWIADHLSDAAVALLARAAGSNAAGVDIPDEIAAELIAAGLIVDGALHDPGTAAWRARADGWTSPAPAADPSVVYYLRRTDGAIKIGFSADLAARVDRLTEVYGPLDLLATEPGGCALERQRHRQFGRWQLPRDPRLEGGSEWFTESPALRRHIRALAAAVIA